MIALAIYDGDIYSALFMIIWRYYLSCVIITITYIIYQSLGFYYDCHQIKCSRNDLTVLLTLNDHCQILKLVAGHQIGFNSSSWFPSWSIVQSYFYGWDWNNKDAAHMFNGRKQQKPEIIGNQTDIFIVWV